MKATTPPFFCASARTCWQRVVLPDDSGPKISVMRPRGTPPTPIARSSAMEPVGMASTCCRSDEPSFMIEPRPNCFSMDRMAASTARVRSAVALSVGLSRRSTPFPSAPDCRLVPAIVMPGTPYWLRRGPGSVLRLRLLLPTWFALGLDDLDRRRWRVHQRLQLGTLRLRLGLLLLFAVRA